MKSILPNLFKVIILALLCCPQMVSCQQPGSVKMKSPGKVNTRLWCVDWSPDDKYVAMGGDDSMLYIFEARRWTLYRAYDMQSMVRQVHWHPASNLLVIGCNNNVQVLNMQSGQLSKITSITTGARAVAWNHNGQLLGVADDRGLIWILDKDIKVLRTIKKEDRNTYFSMDWHPAKNIIITTGDEIRLFDTTGKALGVFKHRKEQTGVLSVAWHPAGAFFATGDYGHETEGMPTVLQFWNADGTLIKNICGSKAEYRNMRWNNSGSLLATASDALRIWTKDGELVSSGPSTMKWLWGVDWNSDGTKIITTSFAGGIDLWTSKAVLIKHIY